MTQTPAAVDLSGNRRRIVRERAIHGFFLAAGLSSLAISAAIIITLVGKSLEFLTNIDLGDLWTDPHRWGPRVGNYDLPTLFMGSLLVTGVAMLVAAPLGLGAAIFLSEYARPRTRRIGRASCRERV